VRRLALYSLPFQPPPGPENAGERRRILGEYLAGEDASRADADLITAASAAVNKAWAGRGLGVQPLGGGRLPDDVQEWPAAVARLRVEEVLLSTTAHEARGFIPPAAAPGVTEDAAAGFRAAHFAKPHERASEGTPWERLTADMTEHQFASVARELAAELRQQGVSVHVSRFEVPASVAGAGSAHCFDVPFVFGNPHQWWDAPMLEGMNPAVAAEVASAWSQPLVQALRGEETLRREGMGTPRGFVRAVRLQDDSVEVAEVADLPLGAPRRVREP
jgi:para-nitrobenzyl esterase